METALWDEVNSQRIWTRLMEQYNARLANANDSLGLKYLTDISQQRSDIKNTQYWLENL